MNNNDNPNSETAEDVAARITDESVEPIHDVQMDPEVDIKIQEMDDRVKTIPEVIDSPEAAKEAHDAIGNMDVDELKAELKNQILEELKDEQVRKMELERERRERETAEQQAYISKMKQSPDPWVDIIGWVRSSEGVRTELEWNDAFVDFLRAEGVTGVDDDDVVQKWVALMMHDMADRMEGELQIDNESEFAG